MEKKLAKTPEQIAAEKAESERLIKEIGQCISRVPQPVLAGDVMRARAWKEKAFKAMKLAESAKPKLDSLRSAVHELRQFEKVAA